MKNLLEKTIQETLDDLRVRNPQFCGCEQCGADVMTYALNKIRPRYTSGGDLGVALANLDLRGDNARATIAVTVMEAMRRVGTNPYHSATPSRAQCEGDPA